MIKFRFKVSTLTAELMASMDVWGMRIDSINKLVDEMKFMVKAGGNTADALGFVAEAAREGSDISIIDVE